MRGDRLGGKRRRLFPRLSITLFTDLTDDTRPIPPFDLVRTFHLPPLPGVAPWSNADDLAQVPYQAAQDVRARQFVLGTNQPSLALLVRPGQSNAYGMSVKELPYAFNAHGCPRDQLDGVVVDHFVSYKVAREGVADFLDARGLEFLQDARARQFDAVSVLGVVSAATPA